MKSLIFILLVLQPLVNKLTLKSGVPFDVYNELISLAVFLLYALQVLQKKKIASIALLFLILVAYMALNVVAKSIYPLGFLQIAIYSQWFFYFLYYHSLSEEAKIKTMADIKYILDILLIVMLFFGVFELFFYTEYRAFLDVKSFNRGLGGFYMVSIFGSGASLANFMSFYLMVWFYFHYGLGHSITRKDKVHLVIAFLFLVLSFSRKEVLFMFLFLMFFPFSYRSTLRKWFRKIILFVGVFTGLLIYYLVFFSEANQVAFGDKYIRWRIAGKSGEILMDNLPWGTGVGTFGSRVSLMVTDIYKKYDIGPEMLGYKSLGQLRGPIYDAFFFTFTTEMGIGILLFLFFFFKLFNARALNENKVKAYIKNFLILYVLGLSVFQPVLISSFGYLCAIFLGLSIHRIPLLKFRTYAKI